MDTVYDLSKMTRSLKTDEKVIAFTGFSIDHDGISPARKACSKYPLFPDRTGAAI